MKVQISKIKPSPWNERTSVKELANLVDEIKENGFHGSLLVRPKGSGYEAAYGSRRLQAAKKAGVREIYVDVQDITDEMMMIWSTAENATQEKVEPIERAEHLKKMKDKTGWTDTTISKRTGIHKADISRLLQLVAMATPLQRLVKTKQVGWKTAVDAHSVGGDVLVKRAAEQEMTYEDVREIARAVTKHPKRKKELVSGKVHPADLEIATIKKSHMSMKEMAQKIEGKFEMFSEVLELAIDNWEAQGFPKSEKRIIKMILESEIEPNIKKLKKLM